MTWELFAVFVGSSLRLAVPLLLADTGELVSERAGVLNMSIEGMMLTGAFAAAVGAWATGSPVLALLICIVAVLPVALLQAFLSNTLRANQIVTGIGINILVLGATTLAYREIFGARSREQIPDLEKWSPPLLGRHSNLRRSRISTSVASVCRDRDHRVDCAGAALHLDRHRHSCRRRRATSRRQIGNFRHLGPLSWRHVRRIHVGARGCVPVDRRYPHDSGRRLSRHRGRHFRKMALSGTVLACLLFGAATALQFQLPTLGVDVPNALLIMLPYLLALLAVGGLAGRQTAPRALGEPYLRR
jgi:general nucleoside transport system permease protein